MARHASIMIVLAVACAGGGGEVGSAVSEIDDAGERRKGAVVTELPLANGTTVRVLQAAGGWAYEYESKAGIVGVEICAQSGCAVQVNAGDDGATVSGSVKLDGYPGQLTFELKLDC